MPGVRRRHHLLVPLSLAAAALFALDVLRASPWEHLTRAVSLSFVLALIKFAIWAGAAVLVVTLVRRVPLEGGSRRRRAAAVAVHLAASLAVTGGVAALSHAVQQPLRRALVAALPPGGRALLLSSWTVLSAELDAALVLALPWDLLTYWAVFAAVCLWHWALSARARQRRAFELAGELDRAQLGALEAQLHPHFLFNALNTISALLHSRPARARAVTGRLRRLFARLLAPGQQPWHTLAEELALLEDYVAIQKARFGDNLVYEVDADAASRALRVPGLLLQPLVENAVRHGAARRAGPTRVRVRAWREQGSLCLEVHDDGPGCPPSAGRPGGIGLANTRQRLERLYGGAHSFAFEGRAAPWGGARVCIRIRDGEDAAAPARSAAGAEQMPPRLWLRGWLLFAGAMAVLNLLWCAVRVRVGDVGSGLSSADVLILGSRGATAWVLLFPLVYWLTTHLAFTRQTLAGRLLVHAPAALVMAVLKAVLVRAFEPLGGPSAPAPLALMVAGRIYSDLLHYAVMAGLCHALYHYGRHVSYGLRAARLEAELAGAELQALRLRVQPQALLDTLADLEELIARAPAAADRLIVQLGDRLRQLLRTGGGGR
jgi:two-component system, LytTR family, sensor kinase